MVSTDQVATVTVLTSEPTVTYYANFSGGSGSKFKITEDAGISEHGTVTYKVNGTETTPVSGVINVKENDVITVAIDPDDGWSATPSGQWSAAIAASRGSSPDVVMEKDITFTSAGENTWTFTMERANAVISVTACKLLTHADISIGDIADVTYNGGEQKPAVVVKDGDKTLVENTDYTLSYSNTTNAGTATVTITGIGKYGGEVKKTYGIQRLTVRVSGGITASNAVYNGSDLAALSYTNVIIEGKAKGDDLSVTATGRFSDKNVGTNKKVTISDLALTGKDKNNYILATTGNQISTTASIFKKNLDVIANPKTISYGDAPANDGVTYKGFVPGENPSVLGGSLTYNYSTAADGQGAPYEAGSPAGTYYIIPSGLISNNYRFLYSAGTLTVEGKEMGDQDVSVGEPGPDGIPVISVSPSGGAGPQEGTDYTVAYYDMDRNPVTVEQMMASPGQYIAVLTFKGGYSCTVEVVINVVKGNLPVRGDVNKSGSVELKDVRAFMDAFLNGEIPDDPASDDFIRFDANGDGSINVADAQAILNLALGLNADGSKKE